MRVFEFGLGRLSFPDVKLTGQQLAFCLYLESKGQRFCVDFGYQNASNKAWELLDREVGQVIQ